MVREQVKVSLNESVTLTTWSERVQYGAVKEVLGTATSLHLQQNVFVREIFGLGAVPLRVEPVSRGEKLEMVRIFSKFTFYISQNDAFYFESNSRGGDTHDTHLFFMGRFS